MSLQILTVPSNYKWPLRIFFIFCSLPFVFNSIETINSDTAIDGSFTFVKGEHWGYYSYLAKQLIFSSVLLWFGSWGTRGRSINRYPEILKNIHQSENWRDITTHLGTSEHIPDAILGLLSKKQDKVKEAYWKIDNCVILQGDLSESAKYIIKYLEYVTIEACHKESALELIYQIGNGYSSDENLMRQCRLQSIEVLTRIETHPEIISSQWRIKIKEDINSLKI